MPNAKDLVFVDTDTNALVAELVAMYEQLTKRSLSPASPEKLFLLWVADVIVQERVINNYTGNQNIPSRADGENLDALGELFYDTSRPQAVAARCTVRFTISAVQSSAVLIPAGVRLVGTGESLVWETIEAVYVPIGKTQVETMLRCQTSGAVGNGYAIGQINTLVDLFPYYERCENITVSDSGADAADDEHYYELLRASMDGYSTAGALGGYVYFAKRASAEIGDVLPNSPGPGLVRIYVLTKDGKPASQELKNAVLAACNAEETRPMTDLVSTADPEIVTYDISLTYYISRETTRSPSEIEAEVNAAVQDFITWQSEKMGRDINPSELRGRLMRCGIKREDLQAPSFLALRRGDDGTVPQVAMLGKLQITSGGYEDA